MQLQFLATDEYIFGLVVSVRDITTMSTVQKAGTDKSHKGICHFVARVWLNLALLNHF